MLLTICNVTRFPTQLKFAHVSLMPATPSMNATTCDQNAISESVIQKGTGIVLRWMGIDLIQKMRLRKTWTTGLRSSRLRRSQKPNFRPHWPHLRIIYYSGRGLPAGLVHSTLFFVILGGWIRIDFQSITIRSNDITEAVWWTGRSWSLANAQEAISFFQMLSKARSSIYCS